MTSLLSYQILPPQEDFFRSPLKSPWRYIVLIRLATYIEEERDLEESFLLNLSWRFMLFSKQDIYHLV